MTILGLDIGGANIKAATVEGNSSCFPFPLWQRPDELSHFLKEIGQQHLSAADQLAITMTGELCDCYENKAEGVTQILNCLEQAFPQIPIHVYNLSGEFVSVAQARQMDPLKIAASNWLALANYARRWVNDSQTAILVDIGSTTTDIIPLTAERVLAVGRTDTTRIANHELVYSGSVRTPVCAVTQRFHFRGSDVLLAQELFATMQDVYITLEEIPESNPSLEATGAPYSADGRPLTKSCSRHRLSRMLCADPDELQDEEIDSLARQVAYDQRRILQESLQKVRARIAGDSVPTLISSGSGWFLIPKLIESGQFAERIEVSDRLDPALCEVAPAFAVATLYHESLQ